MHNSPAKQNLSQKTLLFSFKTIQYLKSLPNTQENLIIKNQLIRSATSIGANFEEAQRAQSKKEFIQKLSISHKETSETIYWLKLINLLKYNCDELLTESTEIVKILTTIIKNSKKRL